MDKNNLHSFLNSVESSNALLRAKLEAAELRKKNLQQQALYHLADICPDENYMRILGSSQHFLGSHNKNLENIFLGEKLANENIWGYSLNIKKCSYENIEDNITKTWVVEGKVKDISFTIEFVSALIEKANQMEKREDIIEIMKLDISPPSELLEKLGLYVKSANLLTSLIPSLLSLEMLQKERDDLEETLSSYQEVKVIKENEMLVFVVDADTFEMRIQWEINFNNRGSNFIHNISILVPDEVKGVFDGKGLHPILMGEELLKGKDDVLKFVGDFF